MLSRRTLCVITGTSRGLGKSLAMKFCTRLGSGSVVVIMSRNNDVLQSLKVELESANPKVSVYCSAIDFYAADQSSYDHIFDDILTNTNTTVSHFEQAIIVHNAASVGDVTKWASECGSVESVAQYMTLNVSSMIVLNSHFLSTFRNAPHRYVVEISSGAVTRPTKSWSLYCSGKAARHMFCRVLADEEPAIRVMSYSPGSLDTDMQLDVRTNSRDSDTRKTYMDRFEQKQLIHPDTSAARLLDILEEDTFTSGDLVRI